MENINLDIDFMIPSFSRSIITPSSEIYLIGGDHSESNMENNVFLYDPRIKLRKMQ